MKHKAKEYAKALTEIKKFDAKSFFRLLEKNGDVKKLKEIIILTEKMMLKKNGNKKIILETARPLQEKIQIGKKGDLVEEKINPSLIAGVRLTIDGEKQLDFSMKHILENIL